MPEKPLKDPKGGLTAAGRAHFKKTEGANLKPGVQGPADTTEKQQRKGSFLRRHFANPNAVRFRTKKAGRHVTRCLPTLGENPCRRPRRT